MMLLKSCAACQKTCKRQHILDYGAGQDDDLQLSDEQIIEVERRMADPNRALLSLDEVRKRLRPFGV